MKILKDIPISVIGLGLAIMTAYTVSMQRGAVWWNFFSSDTWTPESRSSLNHK